MTLLGTGIVLGAWLAPHDRVRHAGSPREQPHRSTNLGALAMRFETNRGQFDERIRFLARGKRYGLFLTREGATLALQKPAEKASGSRYPSARHPVPQAVVSMHLVGGRTDVEPVGIDRLPGESNYFVGNQPAAWHTGVESFGSVKYSAVLPGVDVVYYSQRQGELEYDLILHPSVDPTKLAVRFEGAESIEIDAQGNAILHLADGAEIKQAPPVAYQVDEEGVRTVVAARYEKKANDTLAFSVRARDPHRALVIDPTIAYSTYIGGNALDTISGVAVDPTGAVYVAGETFSTAGLPLVSPIQASNQGYSDLFVSKLNASGTAWVYSTYLGGSLSDGAAGIAVDATGSAYIGGSTLSPDYPTTRFVSPPVPVAPPGGLVLYDVGFVTKLSPSGSALAYSVLIGGTQGNAGTSIRAIAVDAHGIVSVTGQTNAPDFLATAGCCLYSFQSNLRGSSDAFYAGLDPSGFPFYGQFIGGSGFDEGTGIAVDDHQNAYIVGETLSTDLQQVGSPSSRHGSSDVFVTKLAYSAGLPLFQRYLGGGADEAPQGVAVDKWGSVYVVGNTNSTDFPTTSAAFPTPRGLDDVFVTKLSSNGSTLLYSTYLGGNAQDWASARPGCACEGQGSAIAVDAAGYAYVTGTTFSLDFPVVSPLQATRNGANIDAFVTVLNPWGSSLAFSTYFGGTGPDEGAAIALTPGGRIVIAGQTESSDFPTLSPAQATYAGSQDGFITELAWRHRFPIPFPIPWPPFPFPRPLPQ